MLIIAHELTTKFVVVVTLEALISRLRLADHRVAIGSPAQDSKAFSWK